MNAFFKKLTILFAAAAIFTFGASNVYAYEVNDPSDKWYADGPMLEQNEIERFNDIETGSSDF
jgi:hypothetical protein